MKKLTKRRLIFGIAVGLLLLYMCYRMAVSFGDAFVWPEFIKEVLSFGLIILLGLAFVPGGVLIVLSITNQIGKWISIALFDERLEETSNKRLDSIHADYVMIGATVAVFAFYIVRIFQRL